MLRKLQTAVLVGSGCAHAPCRKPRWRVELWPPSEMQNQCYPVTALSLFFVWILMTNAVKFRIVFSFCCSTCQIVGGHISSGWLSQRFCFMNVWIECVWFCPCACECFSVCPVNALTRLRYYRRKQGISHLFIQPNHSEAWTDIQAALKVERSDIWALFYLFNIKDIQISWQNSIKLQHKSLNRQHCSPPLLLLWCK